MLRAILGLMLLAPLARADEPSGGAKVYKNAVSSVVWVHSTRTNALATGSGSLIDRERRLILTNYHVVEENPRATIFFAEFRDGQPIPEKQYYVDRANRLGIRGHVVALDKSADLAIIQIDRVPEKVSAIPLAAGSPSPGDSVHSIGNAGKSGALWGYVKGTVRQVYNKTWKAQLDPKKVVTFKAKVVETDSATNHGDSGGPLLNDKGELVGVTEGGAVNAQLISTFVDVSEVKQVLATRAIRDLRGGSTTTTTPAPPAVVRRDKPLTLADNAKLFSADAVKSANDAIAEQFKHGFDVLVETYPAAPAEWIEKARAAKPDERRKMFEEWAAERLKVEKAHGIAVLVCMDPRFIAVDVPEGMKAKLADGFAKKAGEDLISSFKEKKYDAGLAEVLKLAGESYRGDKK